MSFFNPFANKQSNHLDIRDIADSLENVKKSGDNLRARCPICGSNSSLPFILFENGGYYCHSCNEKGGAISLIKDVLKLDFSTFQNKIRNFNPFHKREKKKTTPDFLKYFVDRFIEPISNSRERVFELLYELIPEETKNIEHKKNNRFIGYDDKNDTLAIALIDENHRVLNIKRRKVGDIKEIGVRK